MPPEAGAFRRHCDVWGGVRFKSASVDKPVVFHFLFGKILAEYQQGSEDDENSPAIVRVILKNNSALRKENQSCTISSSTQPANSPRQA
ncbi:Uncharacterised protein [Neisseria meningitidis]|nr:Uncharacterised protein [Neisseria meningitidis]